MGFVRWVQQQWVSYLIYSIGLVAMAALLAVIVFKSLIVGTKNDRLEYLKNYKKGQFAIIYVIAIPLYFLGGLGACKINGGTDVLSCFLESVCAAFSLIKFDFGMNSVVVAMDADKFYYGTMCCCFAVTAVNVLMFSASLVGQRLKNFFKKIGAEFSDNLYVVVGCNEHNIMLLKSLKKSEHKDGRGLMLAKPSAEMRDKLYLNGICYSYFDCENNGGNEFYKKLKSLLGIKYWLGLHTKKKLTVIINTEDDERNLLYVKALNTLLLADTRIIYKESNVKKNKKTDEQPKDKTEDNQTAKSADSIQSDGGVQSNGNDENGQAKDNKNKTNQDNKPKVPDKYVDIPVNAPHTLITGYVFCNVENQSAFAEQIENAHGHIELLNRYEQIAFDFVDKYPLTRYMTDKHIDYSKGLIRDNVDINVCFIGFGPTGRQVFLKLISDSQFFTENKNGIEHKKVHYYVFDKYQAYKDKNLNQTYFRYSREFYKEYLKGAGNGKKIKVNENYLPLPDYPADDWYNPEFSDEFFDENFNDITKDSEHFNKHFCISDINCYDFYDGLHDVVIKDNSFTYIIVAFGEDLENIDLAKKISARLEMWKKSDSAHVFAKVRSDALVDKEFDGIKIFGTTRSVYNYDGIINHTVKKLARVKSFEYKSKVRNDENGTLPYVKKWMKMAHEQRISNFYCCLNMRTKLNLLGFDYVDRADEDGTVGNKEFFQKYFGTTEVENIDGERNKPAENWDKSIFGDGSVRTLFAMQEHQRWNANYLCGGVIPLSKSEITHDFSKDMKKRLVHGNLTTFAGLNEYRQISGNEVRNYDYEIMDFADQILFYAGYKIVTKQEREKLERDKLAKSAKK